MLVGTARPVQRGQIRTWLGAEYMAEWSQWDHYDIRVDDVAVAINLTKREAWEEWKRLVKTQPSALIFHSWGADDPDGGGLGDYNQVWPKLEN